MGNSLKTIIYNAMNTARRDGYDQVIYTDDGEYAFSRDYPSNNMYKPENVIGHIRSGWDDGMFNVRYVPVSR